MKAARGTPAALAASNTLTFASPQTRSMNALEPNAPRVETTPTAPSRAGLHASTSKASAATHSTSRTHASAESEPDEEEEDEE